MSTFEQTSGSGPQQIQFPVLGMSCMGCAAKVKSALALVEGVDEASVDLADNSVTVRFDDQTVNPLQLQQAVQSVGYELIITDK
jgi:Cu2+-exporting ATPase